MNGKRIVPLVSSGPSHASPSASRQEVFSNHVDRLCISLSLACLLSALLTTGLPRRITLDHGMVFYDHVEPEPFPTCLHLWLLADGASTSASPGFRCPTDHVATLRTHQTMSCKRGTDQCWPIKGVMGRPGRATRHARVSIFPVASAGRRSLTGLFRGGALRWFSHPEWEAEMLDLARVFGHLANSRWFRRIGANGGSIWVAMAPLSARVCAIRCSNYVLMPPKGASLAASSEITLTIAPQGLVKTDLIGKPGHLLAPAYQLALPLTSEAWRVMCDFSGSPGNWKGVSCRAGSFEVCSPEIDPAKVALVGCPSGGAGLQISPPESGSTRDFPGTDRPP